jgi:hypothetical protein
MHKIMGSIHSTRKENSPLPRKKRKKYFRKAKTKLRKLKTPKENSLPRSRVSVQNLQHQAGSKCKSFPRLLMCLQQYHPPVPQSRYLFLPTRYYNDHHNLERVSH